MLFIGLLQKVVQVGRRDSFLRRLPAAEAGHPVECLPACLGQLNQEARKGIVRNHNVWKGMAYVAYSEVREIPNAR